MRCNLAFGLVALLAATIFISINFLSSSASSAPENTIASNGKCCYDNRCMPCPDENY